MAALARRLEREELRVEARELAHHAAPCRSGPSPARARALLALAIRSPSPVLRRPGQANRSARGPGTGRAGRAYRCAPTAGSRCARFGSATRRSPIPLADNRPAAERRGAPPLTAGHPGACGRLGLAPCPPSSARRCSAPPSPPSRRSPPPRPKPPRPRRSAMPARRRTACGSARPPTSRRAWRASTARRSTSTSRCPRRATGRFRRSCSSTGWAATRRTSTRPTRARISSTTACASPRRATRS